MSITRHIPNALTCGNLFLGAVGTLFALSGRPDLTTYAILIAALLDFLDGFVARRLNAYSNFGKDLDSLADVISFGFAPAAVYYSMIHFHLTGNWGGNFWEIGQTERLLLLLPFILTVFAGLRLAKFNNDLRQTENFIGLTTTATGIFTVSLGYLVYNTPALNLLTNPWIVAGFLIIFSTLLVSEIPMFSLKFKHFKWQGNQNRYILLAISIPALIFFQITAMVIIIPLYVLFSIFIAIFNAKPAAGTSGLN